MANNTLLRHWQMLSLVPRAPRKVDAATLESQLGERGFEVDRRSIQRDLVKLSAHFPLVSDERSKPYGWSWSRDAKLFDVPGMDLHTALAFALAAEHLAHLLPRTTLHYLEPHFSRARMVLDAIEDNDLRLWRDSVRALPSGLPMAPPSIDQAVLEAVHDGLLHRRQLDLSYRPRTNDEVRRYQASPLGLVYRDSVAYLLCALFSYDNVVQLAVHRMVEAAVTAEPTRVPTGFDLDRYIESGEFGFLMGNEPLQLVMLLDKRAAVRLFETPLSADQRLCTVEDGRVEVRATVADTAQLRVWLRGHGALCEVVEPVDLRNSIAHELASAVAQYGGEIR